MPSNSAGLIILGSSLILGDGISEFLGFWGIGLALVASCFNDGGLYT